MKTHLLVLSSLLLAATFTTPAVAADNDAETIRLTGRPYIERGMTRETVHEMLGAPSGRLGSDVWVYLNFKAVNPVATGTQNSALAEKQDALVVAFKDGRVSLIRACASQPVVAFLARQEKSKAAAPSIASK